MSRWELHPSHILKREAMDVIEEILDRKLECIWKCKDLNDEINRVKHTFNVNYVKDLLSSGQFISIAIGCDIGIGKN